MEVLTFLPHLGLCLESDCRFSRAAAGAAVVICLRTEVQGRQRFRFAFASLDVEVEKKRRQSETSCMLPGLDGSFHLQSESSFQKWGSLWMRRRQAFAPVAKHHLTLPNGHCLSLTGVEFGTSSCQTYAVLTPPKSKITQFSRLLDAAAAVAASPASRTVRKLPSHLTDACMLSCLQI